MKKVGIQMKKDIKQILKNNSKNKSSNIVYPKFKKKDIPNLKYCVIHSLYGFSDGVSIVMSQIEGIMIKELGIPASNISYLVGKSKNKSPRISQRKILFHKHKANRLMLNHFNDGYGGWYSEEIEKAITEATKEISDFISSHKIDVIIGHNLSHPENFITSVALSRYYRDSERSGLKTPKYLLWWHDSHLERPRFNKPAIDVGRYLFEGVPGLYVEYILFINSMQFIDAQKYMLELDKIRPGFFNNINKYHDVIYNTTDTFIESYDDLALEKVDDHIEQFISEFKVRDLLERKGRTLKDVFFCLQHTRIVERKRIDFALKYCFELLKQAKKKKKFNLLYFFVSGHRHSTSTTKRRLKLLYNKLSKEYNTEDVILVFNDEFKSNIQFEEFPRIFAKLGGFSTYFSEIEGFGNNLLEVMASGLIPVIYTYPVFLKDIAKYKFKCIALDKFEIQHKDINKTLDIVTNQRKRKIWVNKNLDILKKKFPHKIMARKLKRAIIRRRTHF
jgi:mannosylglucosylglycerate synthase